MTFPVQYPAEADLAAGADEPLDEWEGRPAAEIARLWQVPELTILSTVGSTNDAAKLRASQGSPTGTAILAERQVAGRGRAGRVWSSPPGLGLYLSVVTRPDAALASSYPLRVAVAIARSLDRSTGGSVAIKWPNDLLLHGRKVGGILCEATWVGDSIGHLIIGVGLNVLHRAEDFPRELRDTATSIRSAAPAISRFEVASEVVRSLHSLIHHPHGQFESSGWRDELARRNALAGRRVRVSEPESGRLIATGTVHGVADDGALELLQDGGIVRVRTGTIRVAGDLPV